jgi:glycosyltransferase involved in cell wall biosynthesis
MNLDVVIPSYNRATLLIKTLESLFRAIPPPDLQVSVAVVDNNSKDETPEVIRRYPARYVFEQNPGRSHALNAGITQTSGDLVAMIDDDEEIASSWYTKIADSFRLPGLDFIGGPYLPKFEIPPPKWLTGNLRGAVGWMDFGNTAQPYGHEFPGLLLGGNVVIKRAMLDRVGLYNTSIGRTGKRLMTGEDDDMYARLLKAGARGMYCPDLVVHHWIPATRLSKRYLRKWTFWAGVSEGIRERLNRSAVPTILSIPRYRLGKVSRVPLNVLLEPGTKFNQELAFWSLSGFVYGRFCYKDSSARTILK